jgi:lipopolysaccharide transport system permease protein
VKDQSSEVIRIEPEQGVFDALRLAELASGRELLYFLVWRDLKVRYRQTLLGFFWVVLQPVLMMGIYCVVFGSFVKLPSGSYPYALFVLAGIIPWTFVSNAVSESGNSLLANAHLISKVYFPRLYLPLARILVLLFDFAVASLLLFVTALCFGVTLSATLLLVPLVFLLCACLSLGTGALFTALNVKYRDFHYIVPFSLQVCMFCTPIIYPAGAIPARYRWVLDLNPMTGIVETYRFAFLGGELRAAPLIYSVLVALGVLLAGVMYFNHAEHGFADII